MIFMKNPGRPEPTSQWAHLQSGQTVTDFISFPQEDDVNEHKVLMIALCPPCLRPSVCPTCTTSLQGHVSLAHARACQVWWPCGTGHACGCAHGRKGSRFAQGGVWAATNPMLDQVNTSLDHMEERNEHLPDHLQSA